MDRVRFGRALGVGAREAAKALLSAADAAASPSPAARPNHDAGERDRVAAAVHGAARTVEQAKRTGKGVREGSRRFGEAIWGPFVKLGGVLWLEFTGVFFALFAVFAGLRAWKDRANLHDVGSNHAEHVHLLVAAGMTLVFGYFCVSSFVKASRRGRP
jgi:hypothetical protein